MAFPYFRIKMEILCRFFLPLLTRAWFGCCPVTASKKKLDLGQKIQLCMQFMNIPTKLDLEQLRFMLESAGRQFTVPVRALLSI